MTEIPEEAVQAAIAAFDDFEMRAANAIDDQDTHLTDAFRVALAAALPHLRVQETRQWIYCTEGPCDHVYERHCSPSCHTPEYWRITHPTLLVADRAGENALAEWLEEVFSTDEDTITWEMAAKALFDLGAVREESPAPRPVVDRGALRTLLHDMATWQEPVEYVDEYTDRILALLPTEEDTKGAGHGQEDA